MNTAHLWLTIVDQQEQLWREIIFQIFGGVFILIIYELNHKRCSGYYRKSSVSKVELMTKSRNICGESPEYDTGNLLFYFHLFWVSPFYNHIWHYVRLFHNFLVSFDQIEVQFLIIQNYSKPPIYPLVEVYWSY